MSIMFHHNSFQRPQSKPICEIHQLKEGTELLVEIASKIHHAIVTDVCHEEHTFEVIHLTCVDGENGDADCQKLTMNFRNVKYYMYDYCDLSIQKKLNVDGNVVKLRACILYKIFHTIKDLKYDNFYFNCDHFASYCITGSAFSKRFQYHNGAATELLDRK